MKISFFGAAKEVTGSCFMIETNKSKILVDCGMYQGNEDIKKKNFENFKFNPREISCIILTHTHIDHSGLIPKIVKEGFGGRIYMTHPTSILVQYLLYDSAKIQENAFRERNKERKGRKHWLERGAVDLKLYETRDVDKAVKLFVPVDYNKKNHISNNVKFVLRNAGHVLGAASVEIFVNEKGNEKKVVFSGDIGNTSQSLVKSFDRIKSADYVVMESLYGGKQHQDRRNMEKEFVSIINQTLNRGGNVVVPSFSVQRSQEILYEIKKFKEEKLISNDIQVYLDSPLSIKVTEAYSRYSSYLNDDVKKRVDIGDSPYKFNNLHFTKDSKESIRIRKKKGVIVLAGSGMCEGGRILYHLADNLEKSRSSIVFVGFQAEETLGRKILEGLSEVIIMGKKIKVKAKIHSLLGFSAHADHDDLLLWLGSFDKSRIKKVFAVHAEEDRMNDFKNALEIRGYDVVCPSRGEAYEL